MLKVAQRRQKWTHHLVLIKENRLPLGVLMNLTSSVGRRKETITSSYVGTDVIGLIHHQE